METKNITRNNLKYNTPNFVNDILIEDKSSFYNDELIKMMRYFIKEYKAGRINKNDLNELIKTMTVLSIIKQTNESIDKIILNSLQKSISQLETFIYGIK